MADDKDDTLEIPAFLLRKPLTADEKAAMQHIRARDNEIVMPGRKEG